MKIGVLDIQGSVAEHVAALKRLGVEAVLVKKVEDLAEISGLIMPGGESTTIGMLMGKLEKEIVRRAKKGMAIWGTCAGAILMARMGLLDVEIERNAYGRQQESFETEVEFCGKMMPAVFIRAPKILSVGEGCEVLAKNENDIVAVREGKMLAITFHPELADDLTIHQYFENLCKLN